MQPSTILQENRTASLKATLRLKVVSEKERKKFFVLRKNKREAKREKSRLFEGYI